MKYCVEKIINFCCKHDLVSEKQIPWLRYSIEKRLASIIGLTPFAILAAFLSDFGCAIWFVFSFCFLRGRINGFHSKTLLGCVVLSLFTELAFFILFYSVLTPSISILTSTLCFIILLLYAPYNHPNIHYSSEEILCLKKSIRHRISMLALLLLAFHTIHANESLRGLTLGIAMAAYMLSLAYILEWRKHK